VKISRVIKRGETRWRVAWRADGRESRRFFRTKGAAEAFGGQLAQDRDDLGGVWLAAAAAERMAMTEALRRAQAGGYTLADACAAREAQQTAPAQGRPLAELAAAFLSAKRAQGLRPRSVEALRYSLATFLRGREQVAGQTITPTDIAAHLDRPNWGARTRLAVLIDLGTFFSWCVDMEHLPKNPCVKVPRPRLERTETTTLSPAEAERLLRACERLDPELLGFVAIATFGGLRTESEVARLKTSDLHLATGSIRSPVQNKTRRARLVTIQPNLRAWLAAWLGLKVPLMPVNFARRWRRVRQAAGLEPWPRNVLRHSFATYHFARWGHEGRTAKEAGHRVDQLHATYKALRTEAEAKAFFSVAPDPAQDLAANARARPRDSHRGSVEWMREITARRLAKRASPPHRIGPARGASAPSGGAGGGRREGSARGAEQTLADGAAEAL
jgi:integrase